MRPVAHFTTSFSCLSDKVCPDVANLNGIKKFNSRAIGAESIELAVDGLKV